MKQFSCGDVVPGCRRTFRGTEVDVLAAVAEHARVDHGMSAVPVELVEQVRASLVAV